MKGSTEKIVVKKLCILALAILLIFGILNLTWFVVEKMPYNSYAERLELSEDDIPDAEYYEKEIDGYTYRLKMPAYLSYDGGFLTVYNTENHTLYMDDDGSSEYAETVLTLFIYPEFFGETSYIVSLENDELDESISIDSELNYLPLDEENYEENEYCSYLLSEYYDEIKTLMDKAQELWELE